MERLWVFAAALLFSTGGVAIKGNSLNGWQVASFRSLAAAVTLCIVIPGARHHWTKRHAIAALAYAGALISFVAAMKKTTAANAIFLQSTAPAYLVVLSPLLLNERLRRSDFFLLLGVGTGMLLFFIGQEPATATAPDPGSGDLIALLAGLMWALTMLGLRWVGRHDDGANAGMATVTLGNLLAFAMALPVALPVQQISARDVLVVSYLGIFQIALAYYCLTRAITRLSAFEAATLLLIEPALNPLWTWMVLGEQPLRLSVAGGVVILASTLANTWWRSRTTTRVLPSDAV